MWQQNWFNLHQIVRPEIWKWWGDQTFSGVGIHTYIFLCTQIFLGFWYLIRKDFRYYKSLFEVEWITNMNISNWKFGNWTQLTSDLTLVEPSEVLPQNCWNLFVLVDLVITMKDYGLALEDQNFLYACIHSQRMFCKLLSKLKMLKRAMHRYEEFQCVYPSTKYSKFICIYFNEEQ